MAPRYPVARKSVNIFRILFATIASNAGAPASMHSSTSTGVGRIAHEASSSNPSLAPDPTGSFIYAANGEPGTVSVFLINADSGALSASDGPYTTGAKPFAIAI